MKKFVSKLVLVALLIGLTVYLYNTNSKSTIKEQLTDFAVKDTASITKIFMADKKQSTNYFNQNRKYLDGRQ